MVLNPLCEPIAVRHTQVTATGFNQPASNLQRLKLASKKLLLIMKFTAIFLVVACITASATGFSQQVSIQVKNASLEKVFEVIKKQTGYQFLYGSKMLKIAKPVSIDLKNASIEEALEQCFKGQPLSYNVVDKTIIIKPKVEEEKFDEVAKVTTIDVSGKVTDTDGNPLFGATVAVKGTSIATKTDVSGVYLLKGIDEEATLEISFAEHENIIIQVKGRSSVMVSLKKNISPLDEVQVIAYGTRSKRFETGNVTTVNADVISKQPVNNVLLAIADRVPGLFITQATGLPGSGVNVKIQGPNSLSSGSEALYVIDGVPYTSQLLPNYGSMLGTSGLYSSGNPLSFLNPADIESISVLKDADATAIYGSRGANGVILITTKKAKTGQTRVDVNVQNGWGKVGRKLDLLTTPQYLEMRKEAKRNDNSATTATDYDINGFWDARRNTDWQKELIGNTANYTQIQLNVSGGTNNTQVLAGFGYHKETTVFPGNLSDQKGSLHFSINNVSTNQKFRIMLSGNYLEDNNRLIPRDLTEIAVRLAPNAPTIYNEDGTLNWMPNTAGNSTWNNPLAHLNNRYNNKTKNLVSNAVLSYRLFPGLEIKTSFGYTNMQANEIVIYPLTSNKPEERATSSRYAFYSNNNINSWILEPQISYKSLFAKSRIETLIGTTFQRNANDGIQIMGLGYNSDVVLGDIRSAPSITIENTVNNVYKYSGIFSRVSYQLLDRYLVNLTARRDGSSRFGPGNQFHNFGAIGLGWIFSNETFFRKTFPIISFGKLTASYGSTGADQIGDYRFMSLYYSSSYGVPYQGANGLGPGGLENEFLQWEETRKLFIGLDVGLYKDRIIVSAHYARNRSDNQLLNYNLPIQTGFGNIARNLPATLQNASWEFTLHTSNIKTNSFSWFTDLNLTIPTNKLLKFPDIASSGYAGSFRVGEPITRKQVYRFAGINPSTGIYQFWDSKGNLTSLPASPADQVFINTAPVFYGGIQNGFTYKNFQLDFSFQFIIRKGGNYLFGNSGVGTFTANNNYNQPTSLFNRWQKTGDQNRMQRYSSNFSVSSPHVRAIASDAAFTDASFGRLKNLSLSWKLPEGWCNRTKLKNARIYMQGQNLLTITKYYGLDPETLSSTSLPPLRIVTIGLQVGL